MSKKKDLPRIAPQALGLLPGGADAHAHLDSLSDDLAAVMERAEQAGITHIGQVFLGPAAYRAHQQAMRGYPGLFFLLGVHPCDALECTGDVLADMRAAFSADDRLKGVGEIGLDFYWKDCPHPIQEEAFRLQLALARDVSLPVVIHSRDAAMDTLRILEAEGLAGRPVLWHCFSGDAVSHLDRILANGWHVSIPGPVTYPANQALRDAAARVPLDRLHVETDCPYLAPLPWRGKPNEPAYVVFTAAAVAKARNMTVAELWAACGRNTTRFFGVEEEKTCLLI